MDGQIGANQTDCKRFAAPGINLVRLIDNRTIRPIPILQNRLPPTQVEARSSCLQTVSFHAVAQLVISQAQRTGRLPLIPAVAAKRLFNDRAFVRLDRSTQIGDSR